MFLEPINYVNPLSKSLVLTIIKISFKLLKTFVEVCSIMGSKKKHKPSKKINLRNEVIGVFQKSPKRQFNHKQVAAGVGVVNASARDQIVKLLQTLAAQEVIKETERGKFQLIQKKTEAEGIIDITRSGSAYVVMNSVHLKDVFIHQKNLGNALHGDLVSINVFQGRNSRKLEGEVVEVLERAKTEFVGIVEVVGKFAFLIPDDPKMNVDLYIPLNKLNGAKHGEKAIAKMGDWPKGASSPFGEINDVLGVPGEHDVEMYSILAQYGFPHKFPDEVEREAAKLPIEITEEEVAKRRDFREVTTFTIDPVDAKDFDDALSIKKLDNGNFEIGIHIADVSHYVKEGSLLDKEAVERATSIYLVDRVVPMLPEVLSNNVCSLRPHEEKLCFACVFEITEKAKVVNSWIGRTVIYSDRRYHYDEVQAILEGVEGDFKPELEKLNTLAKTLREKRMGAGAIGFDKVEVRFTLDEEKQPNGVFLKVQKDAHKLIEEFMLLANRTVAETIGKPKGQDKPKTFVYRIHDTPDPDKLADFVNFIKRFGYQFKAQTTGDIAHSMNALMLELKGKGEENMIENLAIRTMAKAVYSTDNIGHYGLAFPFYSHFTSPIRRYPDVMVHRLLERYLAGGKSADANHYEHLCEHSSNMEKKASDAERDSTKYYQVLYMQKSIGQEFKGVVSGVTEWGIYVELEENKCEGMIKLRDFNDDFYQFDQKNYRVIGNNSGRVINLGDELTIRVKHADLVRRQLDFELVEEEED